MKIEMRPTNSVKPYDRNPRDNDDAVEAVARSIKAFGFRQPIVVDADGVIVVGHTRHRAALLLELVEVPVHIATDLSPAKLKAYRIADNKTGELATWDEDMLAAEIVDLRELAELPDAEVDLDALGFGEDELAELLEEDGEPDFDAVPDVPEEPTARTGDIWVLGEHRLLCGDATIESDVALVLRDAKICAVVTDPPYGINRKGITNDSPEKLAPLYAGVLSAPLDDVVVIAFQSPRLFPVWLDESRRAGFKFERALWFYAANDITFPWRGWLMTSQIALVSSKGRPTWPEIEHYHHDCYTVKTAGQQHGAGEHTAAKPFDVMVDLTEKTSGDIYDPFAGSGTTIIAAEQLGRRCFAIEIEPRYVDVCVKRWEQFTGRKAELIRAAGKETQ